MVIQRTGIALVILALLVGSPSYNYAQSIDLPAASSLMVLTKPYAPLLVKGVIVNPADPFKFNFLVDSGDSGLKGEAMKPEILTQIKYFLAALAVPETDLWVNLSPYEKNRITSDSLKKTALGRDMLAQDYILKKLTASLTYPEGELGRKFWDKVYAQALQKFGASHVPVNAINKVWIVPSTVKVYEHNQGAFVVEAKLKIMLEEDYLATQKNDGQPGDMALAVSPSRLPSKKGLNAKATQGINVTQSIIKEIIIPALEQEVNEGAHFAPLRQVYQAVILASWYKIRLKGSILGRNYIDKNKTKGIALRDKNISEKIYQQYLRAFKRGAYQYIKEETDPATQQTFARKFICGGENMRGVMSKVSQSLRDKPGLALISKAFAPHGDMAMVETRLSYQHWLTTIGILAPHATSEEPKMGQVTIAAVVREGFTGLIVGHPEIRIMGESHQAMRGQINAAFHERSLKQIILSVGETKEERAAGQADEVIEKQLAVLGDLKKEEILSKDFIISYEPLYTGSRVAGSKPADVKDVGGMATHIRAWLREKFGDDVASKVRILYGGQVNGSLRGVSGVPQGSALSYLALEDIDGLSVGRNSTIVEEFKKILNIAGKRIHQHGRRTYIRANWGNIDPGLVDDLVRLIFNYDPDIVQIGIAPEILGIRHLAEILQDWEEESLAQQGMLNEIINQESEKVSMSPEVRVMAKQYLLGFLPATEFLSCLKEHNEMIDPVEFVRSLESLHRAKIKELVEAVRASKGDPAVMSSPTGGIDLNKALGKLEESMKRENKSNSLITLPRNSAEFHIDNGLYPIIESISKPDLSVVLGLN